MHNSAHRGFSLAYGCYSVRVREFPGFRGDGVTNTKIELLFSYTVTLKMPPEVIGPVAEGIRVNFYLDGGEISGPRCAVNCSLPARTGC
jgi:hypothetical protein